MKRIKKVLSTLLGLALAVGVCSSLAACANNAQPEACLVIVEGGSGGGYYYKDTNCTVTAEVPQDKQFMKWVAEDVDISASETYTFTVTEDIKLTAVFADAVDVPEIYTVNVRHGTGSGIFYDGTVRTVKVYEAYAELDFTGWYLLGEDGDDPVLISEEREFELTVTGNMNVTAFFDNTKLATPDNSNGGCFQISALGAYEFDRVGGVDGGRDEFGRETYYNSFKKGVGHLLYRMYDGDGELVSTFIIATIPGTVLIGGERYYSYLATEDGSQRMNLKGSLGNMYHDNAPEKTKVREIIGAQSGKSYAFTVQAIAEENSPYFDSDESEKTPLRNF